MREFTRTFAATAADIDELGHVGNIVWVRWIQDLATAHWRAAASADQDRAWIWVVVRHEIDYRRALLEGETAAGRTWVGDAPKGAKFDRHMQFTGADGRLLVAARTTWAMLDRASGRPMRVPPEVVAIFA